MPLSNCCPRYNECLKKARKIGAKKGIGGGFSIGFVFFLFFSLDAVAFWQVFFVGP